MRRVVPALLVLILAGLAVEQPAGAKKGEPSGGAGKRFCRALTGDLTGAAKIRVRIAVSPKKVSAGDVISLRLKNNGGKPASTGSSFSFERKEGTTWTPLTDGANGTKAKIVVAPNSAGPCQTAEIPLSFTPGRYRVVKSGAVGPFRIKSG